MGDAVSEFCVKPVRWLAAGAAVVVAFGAADLRAQIQLPDIVVTTPSPVAKPAPKSGPASQTAPAEAPPGPPPTGLTVEDAFVPITVVPAGQITASPGTTLTDSLQ